MRRLLPSSLAGQMALLIGTALLLAQLVSLAYVLVQRQQFNRAEIETPAVTRFASTAADFAQAAPEFRPLVLKDSSHRGAHYESAATSIVTDSADRRGETEARLKTSLESVSVQPRTVRASFDSAAAPKRSADTRRRPSRTLLLSAQLADGTWLNAALSVRAPAPLITPDLLLGTLLLYLFVLGATVFVARRIARPLRNLARAADAFRGRNQPMLVEASGPADLRDAIFAFNAMNERVVKLLEEKDRTLGAIGHDLRTPLASLRIRAESVEPADEREHMIRTIEEMTATLEDILVLARSGRSREQLETMDVALLAGELATEYRDSGKPVTFTADGAFPAEVQANLLRRALRNLIDNALHYGGEAQVVVCVKAGTVEIAVLDNGPGLPADEIGRVTGAFYRAEPSRNRATGGAGLGLAIAQGVAESLGGSLTLANRKSGGLAAVISLPAAPQVARPITDS
jgi:signal transduction histidine kinase